MATANSSKTNSGDDVNNSILNSSNNAQFPALSASPFPSIRPRNLAFNTFLGGLAGNVLGFALGFLTDKGVEESVVHAKYFGKKMAILSGVHSLVPSLLERLRGTDDAINHGIAGCCAGIAMKFPGPPEALLQSCLTWGAVYFFISGWNKPVLAQSFYSKTSVHYTTRLPALALSLQLPLPDEMKEAFSDFHQSLKQRSKATFPISH